VHRSVGSVLIAVQAEASTNGSSGAACTYGELSKYLTHLNPVSARSAEH
jgi:hypothetical protein